MAAVERRPLRFGSGSGIRALAVLQVVLLLWAHAAFAQNDLRIPLSDAGLFDPDRGPLFVGFELLKDAEEIAVRIRDFRGQVVRQARLVELLAGNHTFKWDGRDANGDPLPEGNYELVLAARFKDGSTASGLVATRIVRLPPLPVASVPELLPPEERALEISGSVSSFWRHDGDNHVDTGQVRARTRLSYTDDVRRAEGVLAVIDTYPGGETNWDASQAFAEQRWQEGRIRGVFREGLGVFDDPVKLFSDFKSERRKFGFRVDQGVGALQATGLAFTTEGDVDSQASGAAARLRFGEDDSWQFGAGFTHRQARLLDRHDDRYRNQAMAVDLRVPIMESLTLLGELIHTEDTEKSSDNGYTALAGWERGRLRLTAGYIDLGEDFAADYADPLNGIASDARGIEASADYAMPTPWRFFGNPIAAVRFFDLKRHTTDETLREIDASLRFSVGARDTFFLNWYGQEDENGTTHTLLGSATRRWNPWWSSSLQVNHIHAEDRGTWRFTVDTAYRRQAQTARMALEYIRRSIDAAVLSPFEETSLRLDWNNPHWGIQLQTRYSVNEDDHGVNAFGRVEYRRQFLHRYQWIFFASLGSRSAFEFEKQVEIGAAVRF